MDLTREKWLPVVLTNGERTKISLVDLLNDSIHDVAWPRADFQGAAWEMLIGLLTVTVPPKDDEDWEEVWDKGIEPEVWEKALQKIAPVLQFGAQKPSFLQSFEPLDSEYGSISGLLIDAPGGNTLKLNKDHFVKRGVVEHICPHCAAIALYTIQTNSPAGGAGYRVGMRGGGPQTTLVVPQEEAKYPLWKKLWLNVLPQTKMPALADFPLIFPWIAPTITSDKKGNIVTPDNSHYLQAYWGMPRRIELDFTHTENGICDLCGEHHEALLLQMRSKNYGVQYDGWIHPFSPYRQAVKDPSAPWLALKGQPGGLSYRDWLGLILEREDKFNKMQPAKVVRIFAKQKNLGLWCFAWDMDNAKARCWYQHRLPLVCVTHQDQFVSVLNSVLNLATESLSFLKTALKSAWFENPKEAKVDFSMVEIAFWQETEASFRSLFNVLVNDPQRSEKNTRNALRQWEAELHTYIVNVFDWDAFSDPDCPDKILLRQLNARQVLINFYRKSKALKDVLALAEEQKDAKHDE